MLVSQNCAMCSLVGIRSRTQRWHFKHIFISAHPLQTHHCLHSRQEASIPAGSRNVALPYKLEPVELDAMWRWLTWMIAVMEMKNPPHWQPHPFTTLMALYDSLWGE